MNPKQFNEKKHQEGPDDVIYRDFYSTKINADKGKVKIIKRFDSVSQTANISSEPDEVLNKNLLISADSRPHQPTHMCFFYIGLDDSMFEHFASHFESGYRETGFSESGKLLRQLYLNNNRMPDVLFIDIPLDLEQLNQFYDELKRIVLLSSLPVIYNNNQLTREHIDKLNKRQLIDDILTINSPYLDYYSKIIFLKQTKLYGQLFTSAKGELKIERSCNVPLLMKRAVDIMIALTCILLLSPLLVLIAILIKLESKGPVFYTSLRAGKGFRVFKFYKFRSMCSNADKQVHNLSGFNQYNTSSTGPLFFKVNKDPRITRIGKFLRNTSADELPQLFNVLIGDMSIVGNRPLPIYEAVTLTTNEFAERFVAPAGITGLWQVNKRGKAEMSSEERINLDITYSRNYNFLYDLKIIVKTPFAIFQKSDV